MEEEAFSKFHNRDSTALFHMNLDGWSNALYFTEDYDEKDFVAVDQLRDKMRDNDPDYVETSDRESCC